MNQVKENDENHWESIESINSMNPRIQNQRISIRIHTINRFDEPMHEKKRNAMGIQEMNQLNESIDGKRIKCNENP